jgi:hypothetical protein
VAARRRWARKGSVHSEEGAHDCWTVRLAAMEMKLRPTGMRWIGSEAGASRMDFQPKSLKVEVRRRVRPTSLKVQARERVM